MMPLARGASRAGTPTGCPPSPPRRRVAALPASSLHCIPRRHSTTETYPSRRRMETAQDDGRESLHRGEETAADAGQETLFRPTELHAGPHDLAPESRPPEPHPTAATAEEIPGRLRRLHQSSRTPRRQGSETGSQRSTPWTQERAGQRRLAPAKATPRCNRRRPQMPLGPQRMMQET